MDLTRPATARPLRISAPIRESPYFLCWRITCFVCCQMWGPFSQKPEPLMYSSSFTGWLPCNEFNDFHYFNWIYSLMSPSIHFRDIAFKITLVISTGNCHSSDSWIRLLYRKQTIIQGISKPFQLLRINGQIISEPWCYPNYRTSVLTMRIPQISVQTKKSCRSSMLLNHSSLYLNQFVWILFAAFLHIWFQ